MLYDLHTKLSILHTQLYDLGESNNADVVRQRKKILDEKQPLIDLYENLFALKEEYFVTNIVNPMLEQLLHNNADFVGDTNKGIIDYNSLSDIELERTRNRISSKIVKLQNRLNYQSISKLEEKNPMPDSPKRKEIEDKIQSLKKERELVYKLVQKRL